MLHAVQHAALGRRGQRDQPMRPCLGVLLDCFRGQTRRWGDRDLQLPHRIRTTHLLRKLVQSAHIVSRLLRILHPAVPSLASLRGSFERRFGVPADVNGNTFGVDRPRVGVDSVELPEPTVEAGIFLRPERAHGVDRFVGAAAPLAEGRADRIKLRLQIARADAENCPAI